MDTAVKFPTTPEAIKAAPLKLGKRIRVEQAFVAIARNCLDQILANEAGVARFHDVESVHQMRVGLRRLHAALAMFDEVLRAPADVTTEHAWLMDQLGQARDWDVLLADTLHHVEQALPENPALAQVKNAAREKGEAAHARAADAVASPRFKQLTERLAHWLELRGWRDGLSSQGKMRLKMRATDFADNMLAHEQQRLLKRGRKLKDATPKDRHRVRIATKRARYATEFFASLYPGKRVRPYVAALTALQGELGALNDGDVATRLLGELCEGNDAVREGAALASGYLAACEQQGGLSVRRLWKKLTPFKPPY
ncbi:MAG: CHAD domain-containing protein [Telluria sp.]